MKVLEGIANAIDRLVGWVEHLCLWLVSLLVLVGVYNVLARYLGRFIGVNLASNQLIEGQWYLFSVIFLLGFAVVQRRNQHVRVDFLYSKQHARRRALINLLGTLLMLIPFCLLAIAISWEPVRRSWGFMPNGVRIPWEVSPDPGGLPRAPLRSMLIVGFGLLLLQAIADAIKHAVALSPALDEETVAVFEAYEARGID